MKGGGYWLVSDLAQKKISNKPDNEGEDMELKKDVK
jgi:hypothetical protein